MNSLLKWSIENSDAGRRPDEEAPSVRGLDPQALAALMGGPTDADLMKEAIAVIRNPEATLDNKIIAFDNFEQLVENIDNANNLEPLGLWTPLIDQLNSVEADMRRMASWCLGTAVQNNVKAQERMLAMGAYPRLTTLALEDKDTASRRKAVYALSSGVRNYQPGLDEVVKLLPHEITGSDKLNADDMDAIDSIMEKLRKRSGVPS
ncbi:putative hsp70 nucleotide exchange factor [Phaeomoniella chlamydospora]|uniref:Hsp70 nucleotide exchange factor FES1 n=1 Tax=Phaeomoniella chlamydospora TaxID=158046 RepID=A0A0G2EU25_PHACM|nr:putative hsp70 nucleotide exchange factor [Phaeomoniella chlamydospora]